MSIEILNCPQGSQSWHEARAGAITASMFGEVMKVTGGLTEQQQTYVDAILAGTPEPKARVMAKYKAKPKTEKIERALDGEAVGDWTEIAKSYAFRLAVERISGKPLDEGFETWAMRRGHELEPEARATHSLKHGLDIEEAGFVRTTDGRFGASADGLIGKDGGSEYKCFIAPDSLRPIVIDGNVDDYLPQCQGGLWLTGRKWWHFCVYCPALASAGKDLLVFPMERDDEYIEQMEQTLIQFDSLVESLRERLMDNEQQEAA